MFLFSFFANKNTNVRKYKYRKLFYVTRDNSQQRVGSGIIYNISFEWNMLTQYYIKTTECQIILQLTFYYPKTKCSLF